MPFSILILLGILLSSTYAAPWPQETSTGTEESATSTSAAPVMSPTAPYTVMSARSDSPIHLLSVQARGFNFYLGGSPATYCPQPPVTSCPPGETTIFSGLGSLYVMVPGGQLIYVRKDGSLGYTQAHSASYPEGAIVGGYLTYSKDEDSQFGMLETRAFGATGFMACPTQDQGYQVFAAIGNATTPEGDLVTCLEFDALVDEGTEKSRGAWQYV